MNELFSYTCEERTNYTADISLLKFRPVSKSLSYQAGQYVEISLLNDATLPLSIANAPREDGLLEFHLRHNQNQPMAQQLLDDIAKNPTLTLRGPFGNMTLARATTAQKLVFLAGGTGFAPLKALLEQALYEKRDTMMDLYWGISCPIDAYEEELIQKWRALFSQFQYTIVLSHPEKFPCWKGPSGLIPAYCASSHRSFDNTCVFASGPFEMVKAASPLLINKGLSVFHFVSDMPISIVQAQGDENPALEAAHYL